MNRAVREVPQYREREEPASPQALRVPLPELTLAAVFLAAASAAMAMTRVNGGIALIWPANAIVAALLIRASHFRWLTCGLALFAAGCAANAFIAHRSWSLSIEFASLNCLEVGATVWIFRSLLRLPYPNISIEQAAVMTALFGVVVPGITAIGGGWALSVNQGTPLLAAIGQWWSSHLVGACLLAPPFILYSSKSLKRLISEKYAGQNLATVLIAVLGCYLAIHYVRFPFVAISVLLMIAAFRVGGFGAAVLSVFSGGVIAALWSFGVRPEGLERLPIGESLASLPVLALLATTMPPIAVGLGTDARRASLVARREAEFALAEERERLRITLGSIADAVITADAETRITYINAAGEILLGQTIADLKSRRLDEVILLTDPRSSKAAANLVGQSIVHVKALRREAPCVLHRPDGITCYVRDVVSPVIGSEGRVTGVVVVFQEASADVARVQDLDHRANHDSLTGLANRFEFQRRLKQAFDRATRLDLSAAVLAIDLDRFKAVNDAGGHAAGDIMLRRVAEVLRKTVRYPDVIARLGGDEFAVILPNCPPARVQAVAEKIAAALNPLSATWEGSAYSIGASVGLAEIGPLYKTETEWLNAADQACYQAKSAGRGTLRRASVAPAG